MDSKNRRLYKFDKKQETLMIEMPWLSSKPMEWWLDMCLALVGFSWTAKPSNVAWAIAMTVLFRVPIVTSHTCSSRSIRFKEHALV